MSFAKMYGGVSSEERTANDYYPTPPVATYALAKSVVLPRRVWEPAAGRGHMSHELARLGQEVVSTDLFQYPEPLVPIETGVDFLSAEPRDVDGVITNPPYKGNLAEAFIRQGLDHYPFVATLCRLTFAESMTRRDLFTRTPPARVIAFSGRFSCHEDYWSKTQLGGMIAYAWFVWYGYTSPGETKMSWVDTGAMYDAWRLETENNLMR